MNAVHITSKIWNNAIGECTFWRLVLSEEIESSIVKVGRTFAFDLERNRVYILYNARCRM